MSRQKRTGWLLIVVAAGFLVYFLKVRLLTPGPFISRAEWVQAFGFVAILMLGIINVRMAARKEAGRTPPTAK